MPLVLEVRLADRNPPIVVGRLAERDRRVFFEYDAAFLPLGLDLSPLALPLREGVHEEESKVFRGLHGIFDDSLPDGWGMRLMDRAFAARGIEPSTVTPVQRLQFVGTRAMGALTFHPASETSEVAETLDLDEIAEQAVRIYEGSAENVLSELVAVGGSAQGARPKALVMFEPTLGIVRAGTAEIPPGFVPLLVKFPTADDGDDAGAIEMAYAQMARLAGIDVPPTRLFSTRRGLRCFSVERFDRVHGVRRHVHTLGGLLHASHREFGCTYTEYLKTVYALTRDVREVRQAFRRMVFNVVANNRDDHVKNFAFMMEPDGAWHLTPAYDLIYASGPGGEHSMMIGTEGRRPTFRNLMQVADAVDISRREVGAMLEDVIQGVEAWKEISDAFEVRPRSVKSIGVALRSAIEAARQIG